eukprot:jgi/Chlat1/7228/Chrsp57S06862
MATTATATAAVVSSRTSGCEARLHAGSRVSRPRPVPQNLSLSVRSRKRSTPVRVSASGGGGEGAAPHDNDVDVEGAFAAALDSQEAREALAGVTAAALRVAKARADLQAIEAAEADLARRSGGDESEVASGVSLNAALQADRRLQQAAVQLASAQAEVSSRASELRRLEAIGAGTVMALPVLATGGLSVLAGGADPSFSPASAALSLALLVATCGLFGVTYRYVVRGDTGNVQLKSGAVAAFGLARGFGQLDVAQMLSPGDGAALGAAALSAGYSVLILGFCAAAIEIAFRKKMLKPFTSSSSSPSSSSDESQPRS